MKKIFSVLIIVALMSLASCATQTFQINPGAGAPATDDMSLFFINGIGQEVRVDASAICGGSNKIVKVETKLTFIDIIISGASGGIVTPRHAKVYCKY